MYSFFVHRVKAYKHVSFLTSGLKINATANSIYYAILCC